MPAIARGVAAAAAIFIGSLAAPDARAEGCSPDLLTGGPHAGMDLVEIQNDAEPVLLGSWLAKWDPSNGAGTHCFTLAIGPGKDEVDLVAFVNATYPQGSALQACDVEIVPDGVKVSCDVLAADGIYNPDNFDLVFAGDTLVGRNVDDAGSFGDLVFCKRD